MLTPTELKAHISPDLADPALQRLLDDAYAAIAIECGTQISGDIVVNLDGSGAVCWLPARCSAVADERYELVHEGLALRLRRSSLWGYGYSDYALTVDPYRYGYGGILSGDVTVTLVDQTPLRDACAIRLCALASEYTGVQSHMAGVVSGTSQDYYRERTRLLRALRRDIRGA